MLSFELPDLYLLIVNNMSFRYLKYTEVKRIVNAIAIIGMLEDLGNSYFDVKKYLLIKE
jgi:hypothetical protein